MKGSSNRIDFSLRPAKHAERRMMVEIFRKLRPFQAVEDYRYLGFGSLWFSDFGLFHRMLGVKEMLSMEREVAQKPRFDANKPFAAITMDYRDSSKVLPGLDWARPAFAWLDYDDPLTRSMLFDVQSVSIRCASGSVLAVTVQSQNAREIDLTEADKTADAPSAMVRFREAIGQEAVPSEASEEDLTGWAFGRLSQKILEDQITSVLAVRNMTLGQFERMQFIPICDVEYMDGMKMRTFVGIFSSVRDLHLVEKCGFETLDFLPAGGRSISIDVPVLTTREIRFLQRQLPCGTGSMDYGSIPQKQADNFAKFYRYLPNFAVLEH